MDHINLLIYTIQRDSIRLLLVTNVCGPFKFYMSSDPDGSLVGIRIWRLTLNLSSSSKDKDPNVGSKK